MLQTDAAARNLAELERGLRDHSATVALMGLGYVGLPLMQAFVDAGFATLGFDTDIAKIERLKADHRGKKPGGNTAGKFEPTIDMRRLAEADAILICVPTPLTETRAPDLTHVEAAARLIAASLRPGQLVVLESTTYPGTTRDVVLPILQQSGLVVGKDFYLAYSPERQDPGNGQFPVRRIPKVVGGMEPGSLRLATALYQEAVEQVVPVSSCEIAEACKILENTYRCVNIALVNELKMLLEGLGIDIWEVIAAASTKPFGFQAFYPGPGLGGHCIAIDPFYLSWLAGQRGLPARSIELAGELNAQMPCYVLDRVAQALNDHKKPIRDSKIALLGVAYKKDIDDPRESPALVLIDLLRQRGALVSYNDPHVPAIAARSNSNFPDLTSSPLTADYLVAQDCVLIATDHSAYDYNFIVEHAPLVVDTRNATRNVTSGREKIRKA